MNHKKTILLIILSSISVFVYADKVKYSQLPKDKQAKVGTLTYQIDGKNKTSKVLYLGLFVEYLNISGEYGNAWIEIYRSYNIVGNDSWSEREKILEVPAPYANNSYLMELQFSFPKYAETMMPEGIECLTEKTDGKSFWWENKKNLCCMYNVYALIE
jgi:hypothetical protein